MLHKQNNSPMVGITKSTTDVLLFRRWLVKNTNIGEIDYMSRKRFDVSRQSVAYFLPSKASYFSCTIFSDNLLPFFADRIYADKSLNSLGSITRMFEDYKTAHDFNNYQDSLTDYQFAQYKASTNTPGFTEKAAEMKQFFPRTSTKNDPAAPKAE